MVHKIAINNFPACCGIYILTCFYQNADRDERIKAYINARTTDPYRGKSYTDAYIKEKGIEEGWETKDEYKKRILSELNKFTSEYLNRKSWLIATLNVDEYTHLHGTMLEAGFEIIMPETSNPTGSKIITYGYNLMVRPDVVKKKVKSIVGLRRGI